MTKNELLNQFLQNIPSGITSEFLNNPQVLELKPIEGTYRNITMFYMKSNIPVLVNEKLTPHAIESIQHIKKYSHICYYSEDYIWTYLGTHFNFSLPEQMKILQLIVMHFFKDTNFEIAMHTGKLQIIKEGDSSHDFLFKGDDFDLGSNLLEICSEIKVRIVFSEIIHSYFKEHFNTKKIFTLELQNGTQQSLYTIDI